MECELGSNSMTVDEIKFDAGASPSTDREAKKLEVQDYGGEWTVQSVLQVLGGFMLLFNSYRSPVSHWQSSYVGEAGVT